MNTLVVYIKEYKCKYVLEVQILFVFLKQVIGHVETVGGSIENVIPQDKIVCRVARF